MNDPVPRSTPFKTPSVMRYERIQGILEGEPLLKDFLGPRDQEIIKRDNEKHYFSKGVVKVTDVLHQRGMDAHNTHRDLVLSVAADVLNIMHEKRKVKPEPKIEPAESAPGPKVEAAKPKLKAKAKPKAPAVKKAVKLPAVPKTATTVAPAVQPVQAVTASANGALPGSVPSYYVYASAFSLAISLRNMLELGDRSPGAEGRMELVDAICKELNDLKHVVVPLPLNMIPPEILKHANKDSHTAEPKARS